VLSLYALGFAVYACVPLDWLGTLRTGELTHAIAGTARETWAALWRAPLHTLLDGPPGGFHLWFLPSLACGLSALGLARLAAPRPQPSTSPPGGLGARVVTATFAVCALGLFAFGLVAGRYAHTPLGLPFQHSTRNGPFQAVLLVAVGAALASRDLSRGGRWRGPLLLVVGQAALLAESAWLGVPAGAAEGPDTYSLAVLPLGAGAFLLFHDLHLRAAWAQRAATRLGGATLGVYLWHVLLRVPLASAFGALGLYPRDGSAPWWGFLALFAVSVGVAVGGRGALRHVTWWATGGTAAAKPSALQR
jgi:peptidoglycan/LPS O-acetylase OafA/YrhL